MCACERRSAQQGALAVPLPLCPRGKRRPGRPGRVGRPPHGGTCHLRPRCCQGGSYCGRAAAAGAAAAPSHASVAPACWSPPPALSRPFTRRWHWCSVDGCLRSGDGDGVAPKVGSSLCGCPLSTKPLPSLAPPLIERKPARWWGLPSPIAGPGGGSCHIDGSASLRAPEGAVVTMTGSGFW